LIGPDGACKTSLFLVLAGSNQPSAGEVHQLSWQIAQSQAALEELMSKWEKVAT
jgi:ABC-type branched-subunit amino acid transport system ATPase component